MSKTITIVQISNTQSNRAVEVEAVHSAPRVRVEVEFSRNRVQLCLVGAVDSGLAHISHTPNGIS